MVITSLVRDPTGDDLAEVSEIGIDIEREAVGGDPAARQHSELFRERHAQEAPRPDRCSSGAWCAAPPGHADPDLSDLPVADPHACLVFQPAHRLHAMCGAHINHDIFQILDECSHAET